ncbi:MAG: hypothetical protein ACI82F_000747, partial [Planctomycetota bacterium]
LGFPAPPYETTQSLSVTSLARSCAAYVVWSVASSLSSSLSSSLPGMSHSYSSMSAFAFHAHSGLEHAPFGLQIFRGFAMEPKRSSEAASTNDTDNQGRRIFRAQHQLVCDRNEGR